MDAARQLPQLLQRAGQAVGDPGQLRPEFGLLGRHRRLGGPQVQHQRDQPLLGTVVQVAFDPPPGLVAGGHDPRPGGGQLLAALLQGAGHGVEAALQHPDLADAALRHARSEVAAGEPVGHGGRPADRLHDGPGQVAGEHGDEQDRPAKADPPRRRWPVGRPRPSGAHAPPPAPLSAARNRSNSARMASIRRRPSSVTPSVRAAARLSPGGGHQRDRVVLDIGGGGLGDAPGPRLLLGVVRRPAVPG